jgi:hypothetical protein
MCQGWEHKACCLNCLVAARAAKPFAAAEPS